MKNISERKYIQKTKEKNEKLLEEEFNKEQESFFTPLNDDIPNEEDYINEITEEPNSPETIEKTK